MSEGEVIPVKINVLYQRQEPIPSLNHKPPTERVFHFGTWGRNGEFPTHYLVPAEIWEKHPTVCGCQYSREQSAEDCSAELDQLRLDIANVLLKYVRRNDEDD